MEEAKAGIVWMHPPRDLTPVAVPEAEMLHRQATGWMHADPPAGAAPAPLCEPAPPPAAPPKPARAADTATPGDASSLRPACWPPPVPKPSQLKPMVEDEDEEDE